MNCLQMWVGKFFRPGRIINPPYVREQLIIADRCRSESGSTIRRIPTRAGKQRLLVAAIRPTYLNRDELLTNVGWKVFPTRAGKQRLLVAAIRSTYLSSDELLTNVGRKVFPTRAGKQRLLVAAIRPTDWSITELHLHAGCRAGQRSFKPRPPLCSGRPQTS